jgi:hypothetical protein
MEGTKCKCYEVMAVLLALYGSETWNKKNKIVIKIHVTEINTLISVKIDTRV